MPFSSITLPLKLSGFISFSTARAPINLPQMAELEPPQPADATGEVLSYSYLYIPYHISLARIDRIIIIRPQ